MKSALKACFSAPFGEARVTGEIAGEAKIVFDAKSRIHCLLPETIKSRCKQACN